MNVHQAIAYLESRGILISLHNNGRITAHFPDGCNKGFQEEVMLEFLRSNRKEAVRFLRLREDRSRGFEPAEPLSDSYTLQTTNLLQALQVGDAVNAGLAVLDGPVVFDINSKEITIKYQPLVPLQWMIPDDDTV